MFVDLSKYTKAGFDSIWQVFRPPGEESKWVVGFFCQGVESLMDDGLICYVPCNGETEQVRFQYSSPPCDTIQGAIDESYKLFEANKDLFSRRTRKLKEI